MTQTRQRSSMPDHKGIITINGNNFVTEGPVTWQPDPGFPPINTQTGQRQPSDLTIPQSVTLRGPLSIGVLFGNSLHHVSDMSNVVTWWPGQITRGPQKQSTTFSGPDTFKVQPGLGFVEGLDTVWMFGDATDDDAEPVWYWVGSTGTWISATLNADVTGQVKKIAGMALIGTTMYAVGDRLVSNGSNDKSLYKTTDKTTWAETVGASDETLPSGTDRLYGLIHGRQFGLSSGGAELPFFSLAWSSSGAKITPCYKTADTEAAWTGVANSINGDSGEPRGFLAHPNAEGQVTAFVSTSRGLYAYIGTNINATAAPKLVVTYRNQSSSDTGRIVSDGKRVWFSDGPNVGFFYWKSSSGDFDAPIVGPEWRSGTSPITGDPLQAWSGVVESKQGDVTALYPDPITDALWVAKGGLAASKNATIWRYDRGTDGWTVPYVHSTAERAIRGVFPSFEDDDAERLHFVEEHAAGGDQEPFFLENLSLNPLYTTGWKYCTSGTITDSQRDMGFPQSKAFLGIRAFGHTFTSTFKVSVKDGQDGTTPANSQDITSAGGTVWPDKTDGSSGVGVAGKTQQLEFTLSGTAGANPGPTVTALVETWNMVPVKADGKAPKVFRASISRNPDDYRTIGAKPDDIVSRLQTAYETQVLIPISYTEKGTSKTANVKLLPFTVPEKADNRSERDGPYETASIAITMQELL